jgi:hypothetical protein
MKRKVLILFMLIGLLGPAIALPTSAGAVNVFQACGSKVPNGADVCQEESSNNGKNPIINALKVALEILSIIVGLAAVVMIILGGIKLTMSGGDPGAIKSGRDTVIYALAGVVFVLFAQTIVVFVLNKLK